MLKDRVIKVENKEYYIIEEIDYNNKKYILASICDLEKDTLNEEELVIKEVKLDNDNIVTDSIEDDNLANTITNLLIEKIRTTES